MTIVNSTKNMIVLYSNKKLAKPNAAVTINYALSLKKFKTTQPKQFKIEADNKFQ